MTKARRGGGLIWFLMKAMIGGLVCLARLNLCIERLGCV